jgi:elongation factor Ts
MESDGDIDKAIEVLRKKSVLKAEKKSGRATNEGAIVLGSSEHTAFIVEVDTETDFAAKDASFQAFLSELSDFCAKNNPEDLDDLNAKYKDELLSIIQKIGENIKVSYFEKISLEDGVVASYKHSDNKLAAIVKMDSGDETVGRDIAMQVAANNPMAVYPQDIDESILNKEKEIALATLANENKPEEIKEKIIIGKLNKFKMENSLVEQPFIKDPDKKIKDLLGDSKIIGFLRKKVGE